LLDFYVEQYNQPDFITTDPISIPHRFSRKQDIEIAGFWTAVFAWGQRKTIINKANTLLNLMDDAPYDFVINHRPGDRKRFERFVHRTFQYTDTLYFLHFLQHHYTHHASLEDLFVSPGQATLKSGLIRFHESFFSLPDAPRRTRKHVSTPARKSSCKRINMFLRWMVRKDDRGVDFGMWNRISQSQLFIPLDVHVETVARKLGLLTRKQTDWQAVEELTQNLRLLDPDDPVRYDFALFGLGVLHPETLASEWTRTVRR
jgi:uncharacterized protein (TIGR02757 family)